MSDTTETPVDEDIPKGIKLSSGAYDILKDTSTIILPAAAAFYAGLAALWHWAYSVEVVGTAALAATFLGVILKISSVRYAAVKKVEAVKAVQVTTNVVGTTDPRLLGGSQ